MGNLTKRFIPQDKYKIVSPTVKSRTAKLYPDFDYRQRYLMYSKPNTGNKLPITKKPTKGIQLGSPGTQSGTSPSKIKKVNLKRPVGIGPKVWT